MALPKPPSKRVLALLERKHEIAELVSWNGSVSDLLTDLLPVIAMEVGPDPDPVPQIHIAKVKITVSGDQAPGQVARDVAKELVDMRRYRRSSIADTLCAALGRQKRISDAEQPQPT